MENNKSINLSLEQIRSLKNYACRANDFELAAILRDTEKNISAAEQKEKDVIYLNKIRELIKNHQSKSKTIVGDWFLTDTEGNETKLPAQTPKELLRAVGLGYCAFTVKEI